jgi:UDP-N-acetylglucosamine--N-acetylmuramyl-(pentapeptide) pyrophosphoryl-undecaprenol N-acetylglucosamine transferase
VSATFALVTGGGTGGHVYPALALADELVARGHRRDEIHFVGSRRGLEATAVPAAGYSIDVLPGRGFDRARTLRALARNVRTAWDTVVAFARAFAIVRRTRPSVVVGVGGYASLPALLAARLLGIPAVVHEADAHPGLANRVAVRLGARPAVSWPGTPLRNAVLTGNPIRPHLARVQRAPVTPALVAVVGGSLGAQRVNRAALELYDGWRARNDVTIHHVTGERDYEECTRRLARLRAPGDTLGYRLVRYEDHMETLYADATLMVCRSGGMTAELAVVGMPAVLVPLPGAPGDHQTRNAEVFVAAGAAVMVADAALDGARLAAEVEPLLHDPRRVESMSQSARTLARPDATARFADLVEEVARARR